MADDKTDRPETPIFLFAYDFPHTKTQDLLLEFVRQDMRVDRIFAAPFRKIEQPATWKDYPALPKAIPLHPRQLAATLGIPYHVIRHDDVKAMRQVVSHDAMAFIGGARILRPEIIALFARGWLIITLG